MNSCVTLVLLLEFAILALSGIHLTASAPASEKESVSVFISNADQRENEIPSDKNELEKQFRETYALRVKSFMNASVDPCVDFYEYACGNFANVIEDNESEKKRSNLFDILYTLLDQIDPILVKQRHEDEQYFEEMQTAKKFMDSCVNAKLWPLEPSSDFLDVLKEIGGFPAIDPNWNSSNFDWFKMASHLSRYGVDGMVKESIYLKHPFPPYFELPKYGFNFDVYPENIKTKESPGYVYNQEVMKRVLGIYGVNGSKADDVIDSIVEFWRQAFAVEEEINAMGGCIYEFLFTDDLEDPTFSKWEEFFKVAWNTSSFEITNISVCPCHKYYNDLNRIIAQNPEAAANYMALKFLHHMHPNLKSNKFQRTYCLKLIKSSMPLLMSHFYLKEHYKKENEQEIFAIIFELKDSLKKLVETSVWLDEETKLEALKKVKTLQARVGQIEDPISDALIKQIRNLKPSDSFSKNILELSKFSVDLTHYLHNHPEISNNTIPPKILEATQVNAFHYVLDNSINVMAGILNPPAYHSHMPLSAKYGAFGYILGHELTHGFDTLGSRYDSNFEQRNWWSPNSTIAFQERSNCFAKHYGKYKVPELNRNVNGTTSMDENIADSGGLREALYAYRKVYKAASKKDKDSFEQREILPGLNLSPEQTFFLSFAQLYCSKYSLKHFWEELNDDHPLDKYRVLGSLQNFEEFALVYDCPLGSPMNPNEKCRLW